MKKILTIAFAIFFSFSNLAYAEMRYGISAALTMIDATGSETEGGETNSGGADNIVVIPSVFVEFDAGNNLSVGLDYIPMDADVSDDVKQRSDTETSVTGTVNSTTTSRTQKAQAELTDHITLYANYDLGVYYVKAGVAQVTINTTESLGTGSTYGNVDIYGGVFGIGAGDDNHRFELVYTDYEDISITSGVTRTDVSTANKIEADLDTLAFKYSYVF